MEQDNGVSANWKVYHEAFQLLIGPNPSLELLLEDQAFAFAHEAGVFISSKNELYITSSQFYDESGTKKVRITKIQLHDGAKPPTREEIPSDEIQMGNGGVNYEDGILFCAQGSMTAPSGLYKMSTAPPHKVEPILTSFYGRPFNSVNDVVIHSDGSIWFTDPIYGFEQGFRPKPRLPCQVYRYNRADGSVRAMADRFGRPNGICFSPDEKVVYVTDTDWLHGDGSTDGFRASTIYAFDLVYYHGQPSLVNRRLFAMADTGIPDGIKCDIDGNVYSGCGDGVNVWSPGGVLLGKILLDGGVANFCFGRNGAIYMLNENRLWKAQLKPETKGALLRI